LDKIHAAMLLGQPARSVSLTKEEKEAVKGLMLLTLKPVIYAANVADMDLANGNEMSQQVFKHAQSEGNTAVLVSAQVKQLSLQY
jgi:ribosome-binding ATPase